MASRFGPTPLTSYTVATLPASAAGMLVYCTDCLSARGTGGVVYNDGTSWRLADSGALATTGIDTYLNSLLLTGKVTGDGPYDAGWIDRFVGPASSSVGTNILRTMTQTGTGASITTSGLAVTGAAGALFFTSGTQATGVVGWRSAAWDVVNQGYDLVAELVFNMTALSTVADEYWFLFGLTDNASSGSTIDANIIGFLYDRLATWGAGGTATKWKLITRKTGVGTTLTDSTVTVATGTHSLRIYRSAAGTTARFFLDGVQVGGDVSTNLPASGSAMRLGCDMQNTAHAGAAVNCNQIALGYAVRRTAALFA